MPYNNVNFPYFSPIDFPMPQIFVRERKISVRKRLKIGKGERCRSFPMGLFTNSFEYFDDLLAHLLRRVCVNAECRPWLIMANTIHNSLQGDARFG